MNNKLYLKTWKNIKKTKKRSNFTFKYWTNFFNIKCQFLIININNNIKLLMNNIYIIYYIYLYYKNFYNLLITLAILKQNYSFG